ncbi:MAG: GDSL family lipase [Candidatus Woesebacteria bacterium GW2011_GWB1_45_5]|uniref:GDSL family lipase n=1 Tax=Candidatus Woesebacteria bacterium GW2011_GWB1_45_5 TaxID=1618581 RepID=A0A0G1MRU6_9BACT|nr:MAG: GDSL family lipase [Candidatus Woesebacteria bacterium GW2011_GWB1_45_5]
MTLKKLTTVLFFLLFNLVLIEILLRIFWKPPFLDPKYKRNDFEWISGNVTLNRFGYRDRSFDIKKKEKIVRLYALGDSYTYGWYINNYEDAYPKVLERELQAKYGKDGVEVINAARPGFSFEMELARLENEGVLFNPDIVTAGINIQDLVFKEFPPKYVKSRFIRSLRLYWLTHGLSEKRKVGAKTLSEIKKAYAEGTDENKKAEELLTKFADLTRSAGATPVIIIFPEYNPANPDGDYQYLFFHESVRKMAEKHSIKVVDLLDSFNAVEEREKLVLNPIDSHLSVFANEIAGRFTSQVLIDDGLIKNKTRGPWYLKGNIGPNSPLPAGILGITDMSRPWVYFDVKNGLSAQTLFLPDENQSGIPYFQNALKIAFAGKHGGWAGAKLEYHALVNGGKVTVPRVLYGYDVLGVDNIQIYWRVDGAQRSDNVDLTKLEITRDKDNILISGIKGKDLDFVKMTLDLSVSQFNLDGGKIAGTYHTELVPDVKDLKVASRANYVWINDRQTAVPTGQEKPGSVEIAVLLEGMREEEDYPEVEYLK